MRVAGWVACFGGFGMEKYYITGEYGLRKIFKMIKKCKTPDGMTDEEWKNEVNETFISAQTDFLKSHSARIAYRT